MASTTKQCTIRSLVVADRDQWQEKFQRYADFYQTPLTAEAADAVWAWIFDEQNDFWCAVAQSPDGGIVGFTHFQLMHRSLSGGMVCYLSDLYVDSEIRGAGIGRALIDHVFAFARENGISNVRWLTQDYNYKARGLYDSYGRKSDFLLYSFPVETD